jgi:Domain of unknown function (DUF4166)
VLSDFDRKEAFHYLPRENPEAREAFARRQLRARHRLAALLSFYGRNRCRMARIHLLTASAVTLGRFCGFSPAFDAIGAALMPVDEDGRSRTAAWRDYEQGCQSGRPFPVRDELWMVAHVEDMERIKREGINRAFYLESEARSDDPTWRLLRQHMEMTLGARLLDRSALQGAIAYETAMAQGMATALSRLARAGSRLLHRYAYEAARALVLPCNEPARGLPSYRRTALWLVLHSCTAWTASAVYRRGIRFRDRGLTAEDDAWPLLSDVLGSRVGAVDPAIVRFYENPSRFRVRARLELHTVPARFWSCVATLLIGQGLYETPGAEIDARFRVYRRADGSMHFVRELYLAETLRVFDSDFVVRRTNSGPRLCEVFVDHGVEVEMAVEPLPEGGLVIRGERVRLRGLPLPCFGLVVEFTSRVEEEDRLCIDGRLLMKPRSRLGRFVARTLLRRPEELAAIRYRIEPLEAPPLPSQLLAAKGAGLPKQSLRA